MSLLVIPLEDMDEGQKREVARLSKAHELRGFVALERGDCNAALKQFLYMVPFQDKLTTSDSPECAVGFLGLAQASMGLGRWDAAEEAMGQVLKVHERPLPGAAAGGGGVGKAQGLGLGRIEDAAKAREIMAHIKEALDKFDDARELRLRGMDDGSTRCSNLQCAHEMVERSKLNFCAECCCALYCSPACQQTDIRRHKPSCLKNGPAAKAKFTE